MEYGDLLTNFFGCEEKGKEVLEAVDNYTWDLLTSFFGCEEKGNEGVSVLEAVDDYIWDMLDWYHYICKKKRTIDTWENLGVTEYVKFEFISMATLVWTLWETSG